MSHHRPKLWEEFDDREDDEPREPPTCRRCGTPDLEWVDVGGGRWRLFNGNKLHECPPASADDFEDLTK